MIQYTVLPNLQTFRDSGTIKTLGPAYDGESVGFDLYNAGPDINIPPLLDFSLSASPSAIDHEWAHTLIWHNYYRYENWTGPYERDISRKETEHSLEWKSLLDRKELIDSVYKVLIPTGIKVRIPHGYVGLIQERGSVCKTPLKLRAGVVDPGYTGEIFINCLNLSPISWTITAGEKTAFQLIVVPCDNQFLEVPLELYNCPLEKPKRGEGAIDSSSRVLV